MRAFVLSTTLAVLTVGWGCSPNGGPNLGSDGSEAAVWDVADAAAGMQDVRGDGTISDGSPDSDVEPEDDAADGGVQGDGDVRAACKADVDTADDDADGLTNCEEGRSCTDPRDGDTDGDHLGDFEELRKYHTDPCNRDTDGDGVSDKREVELGLDPTRPSSYSDGTPDGKRWIVDACRESGPAPVRFHISRSGNWKVALPPAFSNYTNLKIPGSLPSVAASVYGDPANEVAGFLLTKKAPSNQRSPIDTANSAVRNTVYGLGKATHSFLGPEFQTHDGKDAADIEFEVETKSKKSVRRLREELLFALAPFKRGAVPNAPNTAGANHDEFRVELSLVERITTTGAKTNLYSAAIAPLKAFNQRDRVRFRIDDLTNTSNIADAIDGHLDRCELQSPDRKRSKVEFYFVVDGSPSAAELYTAAASFAPKFATRLQQSPLDYRLGVTNLDHRNKGRLFVPPGWHRSGATFQYEIRHRVGPSCSLMGGWSCRDSARESPFHNAMLGIRHMEGLGQSVPTPREKIRPGAHTYTITWVDEEPQGPKRKVAKGFLPTQTRAFYIVPVSRTIDPGPPKQIVCSPNEAGFKVATYKHVAVQSGGSVIDACKTNLRKTVLSILYDAVGRHSRFQLAGTPISSSLRVHINGNWVPRSRDNGFDYFPNRNTLGFFGSFRPLYQPGQGRPPDVVAIHYETFQERCKAKGKANSCRP